MPSERFLSQLRLFLEELCCDLCLFEHTATERLSPADVRIDREFPLGPPDTFADIRVLPKGCAPYFVEVKPGYSVDMLAAHLRRKYGPATSAVEKPSRLVLVLGSEDKTTQERMLSAATASVHQGVQLEVWDEPYLLDRVQKHFGVKIASLTEGGLLDVREAVERAKGFLAFGGESIDSFTPDALTAELIWQFGFWKLRKLRKSQSLKPRDIFPPNLYSDVVVLFADLCSYSSFVRDTADDELIRDCLTSFYSKSRYEIINKGGMLYQFVGDAVVGLFGIPDREPRYVEDALLAAEALLSIGGAVSHHWQRRIDRAQPACGLRVGLAIGDLNTISQRPFGRTHMNVIGDAINIAARLQQAAGPNEIVISNRLRGVLSDEWMACCRSKEPVDAHNMGWLQAWELKPDARNRQARSQPTSYSKSY